MDEQAARWKAALLEVMEKYKGMPLAFSGGMDSATLLAAMLELGASPPFCVTAQLGGAVSTDLEMSLHITSDHSIDLLVVNIPRKFDTLVNDVNYLIEALGTARKTAIQCAHPLMYIAEAVRDAGYAELILGTAGIADDGKKAFMKWRKMTEEEFREVRIANLDYVNVHGGTWAMHEICRQFGVTTHMPYTEEPVRTVGLDIPFRDMNTPKQKGIALRAFPEFFKDGRYWRANSPMQINSGIREWHDELVTSEHNKRRSKTVVGVYNDMYKPS